MQGPPKGKGFNRVPFKRLKGSIGFGLGVRDCIGKYGDYVGMRALLGCQSLGSTKGRGHESRSHIGFGAWAFSWRL